MAIKNIITCDLTDKDLTQSFANATTVIVQFKRMGVVPGFNGNPDIKCIKEVENYEFHICPEKAPQFMDELKKVMEKLKE